MATKTITGSYPSGYYLQPTYGTLDIASSANVGGSGVTTSSSQTSTISNLGTVYGTTNGVSLAGGGTIINGSSADKSAFIAGTKPITASKTASIINYAAISTVIQTTANGYYNTAGPSIVLSAGGSVNNKRSGSISSGITVAGGIGSVTNDGTIGGPFKQYSGYRYINTIYQGPSIQLNPAVMSRMARPRTRPL